jgi:hypothetical protein
MQESQPRKRPVSVFKIPLIGLAAAGLLYGLLLVPDSQPPAFERARKQPFAWNQDLFWAELEKEFLKARAAGSNALTGQVAEALQEINRRLEQISASPLPHDAPAFRSLEEQVFKLAPLIGAYPDRLRDYSTVVSRIRSRVKQQSERWDLTSADVRETLYRLLAGSRMAFEEAALQAPPELMPERIDGLDEPSHAPAVVLLGVKLHSGDILVSRGGAPTSALIARGNDYPGSFSHVALLHVDSRSGEASVVESHIECGVAVAPLKTYLADKKLRITALRLRADLPACKLQPMLPHQAATQALEEARIQHIPYDFTMDYRDPAARFCSEVISTAYQRVGVRLWMGISYISSPTATAWLGSLGARHFETQEPADLEYDPQLRVIAEWHDRATLLKAHVDDAVTDVMLEQAKPGEPLAYNIWLLPITRVLKAYSLLLNVFGKPAPVPEGMSATVALRVKKYRNDHTEIANRLLQLADEFKLANGYTPPYWELIKLGHRASHELRIKN